MALQFKKATRKQAKLRLAISGPSGSGKTMGALMIAKGIGGPIAVIDTERGSASLYSEPIALGKARTFEPPEFDALELGAPWSPERYIKAVEAGAEHVGPEGILIIDSVTPEWSGTGGCLEINEALASAKYRGNTWSAWSETTPRHKAFLDALVNAPCHIIGTLRSKTETAQVDDGNRKKVVKLGMKAETREGSEYEFTTVLDLIHDGHYATATKDRTGLFVGDPQPLSEDTGRMLKAWLESGASPVADEPVVQKRMTTRDVGNADAMQPTSEPDAPTTDDSMELIELDIGDAVSPEDYRALANRLAAVKKRDGAKLDGAAAEGLRQKIYKLGKEAADALREEAT